MLVNERITIMIELTDTAATHVKKVLAKRGTGLGISIGVKKSGCSGYAYVLEYVDHTPCLPCYVSKNKDVTIFVDPNDEYIINNLVIDYVKEGLNEAFKFVNPQEKARCGCGVSFTI